MYNRMITLVLFFILTLPCPVWAADATDYQQVLINTSVSATTSTIPVGTVITWPVSSNPPDWDQGKWLECNGQSTAGYPELAAVVGANVPNYQGMFLRGYGSQSHTKNNGSAVGNTATTHTSGGLGVIQGDAMRRLQGGIHSRFTGTGNDIDFKTYGNVFLAGQKKTSNTHPVSTLSTVPGYVDYKFDTNNAAPGANEIRPVNIAVRYLIRAMQ